MESQKPQIAGWDFYPRYTSTHIESIDNPISGYYAKADIDGQGKIWLATDKGIAQYDPELNTWKVLGPTQLFEHFDQRVITGLSASSDGSVWVAIEGEHTLLYRFTPTRTAANIGEWRRFDFRDGLPDHPNIIPNLATIKTDLDGNLWIGFSDQPQTARCSVIKP